VDWLTLGLGHNTRVVLIGAVLLGLACGVVGTLLVISRRALASDVAAHAALPGVALGFLAGVALGVTGRSVVLVAGGAILTAGLALVLLSRLAARRGVGPDAASAAILATFFAAGLVLLSIVQKLDTGGRAGLETFLLGSAAGMVEAEAWAVAIVAVLSLVVVALFVKPLAAVAFDREFALASGLPVGALDLLATALALVLVVIGLRLVGVVLIVALLILPAAAARFCSDDLRLILPLAGVIGAASAGIAVILSATIPHLPTGALVTLIAAAFFALGLVAGPARGLLARRRR
jgi:manganese/zinc/iron transport system permease protein